MEAGCFRQVRPLQGLAQSHGAAEFGVGFAEPVQHVQLLLCGRPRVSTS